MLRKLFAVAVLTVATMAAVAATPRPAAAIDFICSCSLCQPGSGLGCRDMKLRPPFNMTSCGAYYSKYCD